MATLSPRVVIVTRETDYELLIATRGTIDQARFLMRRRGREQTVDVARDRHERLAAAVQTVRAAIPREFRQAAVKRRDLDRFLFDPLDIVVIVGQDGLVANVAKYLSGQPVLGVNPEPEVNDGALVRLTPQRAVRLIGRATRGTMPTEKRVMAEAFLDDGRRLVGLNEIFIGHESHQSARYTIAFAGKSEYQSSSGLVVTTGTGATGWARSIATATARTIELKPESPQLVYFVREAWPSRATGASLVSGTIDEAHELSVVSRMSEGGTIFADGIESDRLRFEWGQSAQVRVADRALSLVVG